MKLKDKNISNPFISLVNFKMRETHGALYTERFADMDNEPHRLDYFLSVGGIHFIDDTKAQNVNAIWYSLESINTQITLIVKAVENVQDLLKIKQLLMLKVKNIVLLTEKHAYTKLLSPLVENIHYADTMQEAVNWAYENTEKQDTVLFCAGTKLAVEQESSLFQKAVRKL